MIRLRHERSRERFREYAEVILDGVRRFAEVWAIEAEETFAGYGAIGRWVVRRAVRPRVEDFLAWVKGLADA